MANYSRKRRKNEQRLRQKGLNFRADLHMHTTRSDGIYDTETVLDFCGKGRLDLVAITDHDIGPSVEVGWHERAGHRFYLLHGAELSGVHDGTEYHLLVYFPDEMPTEFRQLCSELCRARVNRYNHAVDALQHRLREQFDEALLASALPKACAAAQQGQRAMTRTHLARGLVHNGIVGSFDQAFKLYLRDPELVPTMTFPYVEAIRIAKSVGGFTSWAHPPIDAAERYVGVFAEAGLDALEIIRPRASSKSRKRLRQLANYHDLKVTGGSDSHGYGRPLGHFACLGIELKWIRRLGLEPRALSKAS